MKKLKAVISAILCAAMCFALAGCSGSRSSDVKLDPKNPTTVTIWNYYNGDQLTAFEKLVSDFNSTVGAEKGIVVVSVSQGSIDNLATSLQESVDGKVGAADTPSAAAIYAETAYILNESGSIVPLDDYFTEEELAEYIPEFINEGRLTEGGPLMMLPVSKSTECFVVNTTDWEAFTTATGIAYTDITSYEQLADAAKSYYEWTDSLTPDVANDGKALYGRDSVSNYIFVGTKELGHEMFKIDKDGNLTVDLDRDTFKTLWDNYYIPFINGYFAANASYRSEDMKTGDILSLTGSSSGISYIASAVTDADDSTHDIEIKVEKSLSFAGADSPVYVQQGAGYSVMKTNDAEQYATVEFLKWFTDTEQNLSFSVSSGYSPVKIEANKAETIEAEFSVDSAKSQNMLDALVISAEAFTSNCTYSGPAFSGSKDARDILKNALNDAATNDRAAVVEKLNSGSSLEDAVKEYSTDEYFDAWFDALAEQVRATVVG